MTFADDRWTDADFRAWYAAMAEHAADVEAANLPPAGGPVPLTPRQQRDEMLRRAPPAPY